MLVIQFCHAATVIYECLNAEKQCPSLNQIKPIIDNLMDSDIIYYIVPNYCGYPCANSFTFDERTAGYFNMDYQIMEQYMKVEKRFIIIISSTESVGFHIAMQQQAYEPLIKYLKNDKYAKK